MAIDRTNLLQTNAIIITGLLILLSLQSLSSPIYETTITQALERMADSGIEFNKNKNLYDSNCIQPNKTTFTFLNSTDIVDLCKKWELEKEEAHQQATALYGYLESIRVLENNHVTSNTSLIIWGPWLAKIITGLILIPFTLSILIEILRKTSEPNASRYSVFCLAIGLVGLIIGLIIVVQMINFSSPWQMIPIKP